MIPSPKINSKELLDLVNRRKRLETDYSNKSLASKGTASTPVNKTEKTKSYHIFNMTSISSKYVLSFFSLINKENIIFIFFFKKKGPRSSKWDTNKIQNSAFETPW